jgi:hypothetical protein
VPPRDAAFLLLPAFGVEIEDEFEEEDDLVAAPPLRVPLREGRNFLGSAVTALGLGPA